MNKSKEIKCCDVPLELHGTCCGWRNAKTPLDTTGRIAEKSHPFYGKDFNVWLNSGHVYAIPVNVTITCN